MPRTIKLNESILSCEKGISYNDQYFSKRCLLLDYKDLKELDLQLNGTLKKEDSIALISFETLDKITIEHLLDYSYIMNKFGKRPDSIEGDDFIQNTYSIIMIRAMPTIRSINIKESINIRLVGYPLCFLSIGMTTIVSRKSDKTHELQTDIEIEKFYLPENNKNQEDGKTMATAAGYAVAKWIEQRNNEMINDSRKKSPLIGIYPKEIKNLNLISFFLDGLNYNCPKLA